MAVTTTTTTSAPAATKRLGLAQYAGYASIMLCISSLLFLTGMITAQTVGAFLRPRRPR